MSFLFGYTKVSIGKKIVRLRKKTNTFRKQSLSINTFLMHL